MTPGNDKRQPDAVRAELRRRQILGLLLLAALILAGWLATPLFVRLFWPLPVDKHIALLPFPSAAGRAKWACTAISRDGLHVRDRRSGRGAPGVRRSPCAIPMRTAG